MSIDRKPGSKQTPPVDSRAEQFIAGAGHAAVLPAPATPQDEGEGRRKPVMIRFDRDLLAKVDKAAKRRGVNRSAWISMTISQALEAE